MNERIIPLVVIALCLVLPGCMTYQGVFGIEATDLSSLHPGMDRAEVEGVLGSPEETDQWQQGAKVHYDYDRGYISPAEESPGTMALAPFILTLEVMFPVMELYAVCTQVCQKGRLEVLYSKGSQLVAARVIPRDFGGCANTARLRAGCTDVANRADPSSFPSNLSTGFQRQRNGNCYMPFAQAVKLSTEVQIVMFNTCISSSAYPMWTCIAANKGHNDAQPLLASLYRGRDRIGTDLVRAYTWYTIAGTEHAIERRVDLIEQMTPAQLAEAERLVAEWKPNPAECETIAAQAEN